LAKHRLVFSQATFDELESRLWRPKFDRYLDLETRRLLLHDFNAVAGLGQRLERRFTGLEPRSR
jgi:predicted nucleic acid-binding protein